MSYQRCQQETTSTEFLDWMEYLKQDVNAFHREDYFLANIARYICVSFAKDSKKVPKLERFLLRFTEKIKIRKKIGEKKSMTKEEAAEKSKRHFLPWAGVNKKKGRK